MHDDAAPSQAPLGRYWRFLALFLPLFLFLHAGPAGAAALSGEPELRDILKRANAAFESGEYRDAVGLYERLTRLKVDRDQYWLNYGATLVELGRSKEGIIAFRRAIRLRGKLMHAAALQLAEAYRREGDSLRARRTLDWLVKQKSLPPGILSEALALSVRVDETHRSRDDFDELVNRGIWKFKNKQYLDAVSAWNGALQIRRHSWEVFFLVALAKIELGDVDGARIILEDLIRQSEDKELEEPAKQILTNILSVRHSRFYVNAEGETGYSQRRYPGVSHASPTVMGQARVGYRIFEFDEWRSYARYRGKWKQQFSPATTLMVQSVGGALGYDTNAWFLELKLDLELSHFADELFLFRALSGWSIGHRWESSRLALSIVGSTNTAPANGYEYLSGRSGIAKLAWAIFFDETMLELYARYGVDDVGDSEISPTSIVPVANVEHEAGETFRVGVGPFVTLKQGFAIGRRRYQKNAEPGGSRRRDTRFTANLGFGFRHSVHWGFDADLLYLLNNSNVNAELPSDQRFREYAVKLNVLWDIVP